MRKGLRWVTLMALVFALAISLFPSRVEAGQIVSTSGLYLSTSSHNTDKYSGEWTAPAKIARIHIKGNTESGYDYGYVYGWNGSTWVQLAKKSGNNFDEWIDVSSYNVTKLKTRLTTDGSVLRSPTYVDVPEVEIAEPPFAPTVQLVYNNQDPYWQARLSWSTNGNPSGTTYEIWRKTINSSGQVVKDEKLGSTTGTSFVTTNNQPGQYYRFRVRAIYNGKSVDSSEVVFWTAPEGTVTAGTRSLTLNWPAVGNGVRYRILRRVNGGSWSEVASTTNTSYTFSSLDPNSKYEFALAPDLPNGGTDWWANFTGPKSPYWYQPGAPTFSNITQTSLTVSWSRGSNPSSGVTYRVTRKPANGSEVEVYRGTGTSFTDSGLTPGTQYTYKVFAINAEGAGPSASASVWTVPATPTGLRVAQSGDFGWAPAGRGWLVLQWDPVPGATGYAVWVWDGNSYRRFDVGNQTTWDSRVAKIFPTESWLNSKADNSVSTDPFNHSQSGENLRDDPRVLYRKTVGTNYDNDPKYYFRVSAYNSSGESPYSSNPVTHTFPDRTDPTPPQGSVIINEGAATTGALRVQVRVNAQDNKSGLKGFQLSHDGKNWSSLISLSGMSDTKTVDWMLLEGPAGTRTVYARFQDQAGNWSSAVSDTIQYMPMLDIQAPRIIRFEINGGAPITNSRNVTLTIEAVDDQTPQSGLYMRFSNDGVNWSAWEKYQPEKTWTLSSGEGRKQVWVEVQDGAGLIGSAVAEIQYRQQTGPVFDATTFWSSTGAPGQFDIGGSTIEVQFVRIHEVTVHWKGYLAQRVRYSFDPVPRGPWETLTLDRTIQLPQTQGLVTLYANLDDGRTYAIRFLVDTAAPDVKVGWRGGATVTGPGRRATLAIAAQDNLARPEDLMVSVDNGAWMPWQAEIPVTLSGAGPRTVTVRVADPAGNVTVRTIDIYVLP